MEGDIEKMMNAIKQIIEEKKDTLIKYINEARGQIFTDEHKQKITLNSKSTTMSSNSEILGILTELKTELKNVKEQLNRKQNKTNSLREQPEFVRRQRWPVNILR